METSQDKSLPKNSTLESKFQCIWKNSYFPKNFSLEKEVSSEVTILFVLEGKMSLLTDKGKTEIIGSKEMFMIPGERVYDVKTLKPAHVISCSFHIESLHLERPLIDNLVSWKKDVQENFTKLPVNKMIESFLVLLEQNIKDGLDSPSFWDIKKQELFFLLFFYYSKPNLAKFLYYIICEDIQFKEFILNNYQRVKNVQELADLANYSTSGFIKRFQRYFDESPYRWMQKQRANRILNDVTQGVKSLQEIATEYNFSSYQHFANFCKVQFGFPPTKIAGKSVQNSN
jgi:AraC-like DNA-binding protein